MTWRPLLDDALAGTALDAVRDVAVAIAAAPQAASATDRTLFWAYATSVIDEPFAAAAYDAALDDLLDVLERGVAHPALHGGLAGLGWTLNHVMESGADDALATIDAALADLAAADRWRGHYDLTHGLVGVGVYFVERAARSPIARDGLAHVIDQLASLATRSDAGVTWETVDGTARCYDVGVAHGVPGVIALLAHAAALADPPARARLLCEDAMRWLTAQRQAPHGRFPSRLVDRQAPDRARAAWCYGDPGIAVTLWSATAQLGVRTDVAHATAVDAARRDPATCGVRDAGLCHGAAGLGHLFNRMFQASGEPVFADAARGWFACALEQRRPDGIGGFVAWQRRTLDGEAAFYPVASLLEGSIGIALALLAASTSFEPSWDRVMLCDLPICAS